MTNKFNIKGVATGVNIRTPRDEKMDTLPMYEITIPLFWDPTRKLHAENEILVQEGVDIRK